MSQDRWLERWIEPLRQLAPAPSILELGCGPCEDTAVLIQHGFTRLIATDLSAEALAECARRAPSASLLCHDLREPLPFADGEFDAVLASLCLHYFPWEQTEAMLREIQRCLKPQGLLLCRLNSIQDKNYGATGHREIAHHYYDVNGSPKRFFDANEVDALFREGWQVLAKQETTIARYAMPKAVWEVAANKA